LTNYVRVANLASVERMNDSSSNRIMALCSCQKVAVTMWLHTRKIAGSPAVGKSV